jgi:hypothetical protein
MSHNGALSYSQQQQVAANPIIKSKDTIACSLAINLVPISLSP